AHQPFDLDLRTPFLVMLPPVVAAISVGRRKFLDPKRSTIRRAPPSAVGPRAAMVAPASGSRAAARRWHAARPWRLSSLLVSRRHSPWRLRSPSRGARDSAARDSAARD